ncbi:hypothetical protein BH24BAC1_BH24BAC1_33470 [soil metagenome]
MKSGGYSLLLLWIFLLPACGSEQHTDTALGSAKDAPAEEGNGVLRQFTLAPNQAGSVRIGMTVEELKAALPVEMLVEKEVNREGQLYTVYEVLNDTYSQETGLVAEPRCDPDCRIYRIEVRDRKYQTEGGLGIGSTYGELRQAHSITFAGAEEGNLVAVSPEAGLSFLLDQSAFSGEELRNMKKGNIPDSTQVTGILLFEPSK